MWHDPSLHTALVHTLRLGVLATLITVPLGVAMALGLDRWRGRLPAAANFAVLLSFVLPEILLAVALLFVVDACCTTPLHLGTWGQVVGLVTFQLSYPVVIVRARLLTIGKQYEEAAIDLGASPSGAVRRVLLPMLLPAIFASTVLVFADVIDDFVIVRYLSGDASTEPVSVKIYNTARAAPTPALNALATLLLVAVACSRSCSATASTACFTRGETRRQRHRVFAGEACERGSAILGAYRRRRGPPILTVCSIRQIRPDRVAPAPLDPDRWHGRCAPFGSSRMLPARRYVDPAVLGVGARGTSSRGWICVGRADDVAEPRHADGGLARRRPACC